MLSHTRDVIFLDDKEVAVLSVDGIKVVNEDGKPVVHELYHVTWDLSNAEKSGYPHFMLKEIHEQPTALQNTLSPRETATDRARPRLASHYAGGSQGA